MVSAPTRAPRFEADENPSLLASPGYGLQFSLIASGTLPVTPVVVGTASGSEDSYLVWMVFASLVVVGVSTILRDAECSLGRVNSPRASIGSLTRMAVRTSAT